ncbi:PKD domain-containing protein [Pontiellaceae bacterium B1224]|nr:PKD domain-containing protein [Pontiellaceae bacterium B1224]
MRKSRTVTSFIAGVFLAGASQAALVGEWRFEGGSADDTSGNGYNGTIVGSVESVSGVEADTSALEFGATSGWVSIPMEAFSGISNEMTIAMWTFGDADILGDGSTPNSAFGSNNRNMLHSHTPWHNGNMYWDAGTVRSSYNIGDSSKYKGKWNHMVFVINATTGEKKVYINGVQDSPTWSGSFAPISGITAFAIGANNLSGATHYYGKIDEFQLYDHELSATEVSNLYARVEVDFITAVATATPDNGAPPLEVAFDGSGSDASAAIISYSWDFGDGSSDTGLMVTNTYASSGEYTATLIIEDDTGRFATNTVDVSVDHYLTAAVSATPMVGSPPLEVAFDASSSTSSTSIVSYNWDFGDGNLDSGMMVTNIYTDVGVYTAAVVVADSHGLLDTNAVVITVQNYVGTEIVATEEKFDSTNYPSFYTNDLLQTEFLSSSASGPEAMGTARHVEMFNGTIGDENTGTGDTDGVRALIGSTFTVIFDTSVNVNGYDITEISSIAGWNPAGGGRANQGYGIEVTYVDDTTAVLADPTHWAPNDPSSYWTKATLVETNGLALAKNVKSITFTISENAATAGGVVIYREFDVLGTPTAGAPSEIVIEYNDDLAELSWATDSSFYEYSIQSNLNLGFGTWGTFMTVEGTPPETRVVLPAKTENQQFIRVIVE